MFAAAEARGHRAGLRWGLVLPESGAAAALLLAERVRQETGATHGLGVGPVRAIDGVESIEIGLVGPQGVQLVEHRLGGAGTVRMSRAAKTAIDLVRKTVQSGVSATP